MSKGSQCGSKGRYPADNKQCDVHVRLGSKGMKDRAIIVFTRIPEEGKTKTRLMPYLTGVECAGLHKAFLQDLSVTLSDVDADCFVSYTGAEGNLELQQEFRDIFPGTKFFPQEGDGLGDRMYQAMEFVFSNGYEQCLLMGTDVPYVEREIFDQAFDVLEEKDYVLAPTEDGGYWLIGGNYAEDKMLKSLFAIGAYSTPTVLQDTLDMIPSWKSYGLLEEKYDIDTIGDLLLFRESAGANAAEYLKDHHVISVIVPIYNEADILPTFLENLQRLRNRCEVIFVDGGSEDGSLEILCSAVQKGQGGLRLIQSPKGRGTQLNAGAEAANGDVLFFLHVDTKLPEAPVDEILSVIEDHEVGCFGITFASRNFFMWTNKVISNRRAAKGIVFGDQGLFIRRDVFLEAGMFPEIPIMEDYQFSLNLQKLGHPVGMTQHQLMASDRRYRGGTIRKLMVMKHMADLRKRYRAGESPEQLLKEYPDVR